MAVTLTNIELLTPMIVFAVALIFMILGVGRKSEVYCFISSISWFFLGPVWAFIGADTFAASVGYLWYGLGTLTLVFGFVLVVLNLNAYNAEKRHREDLD